MEELSYLQQAYDAITELYASVGERWEAAKQADKECGVESRTTAELYGQFIGLMSARAEVGELLDTLKYKADRERR